MKSKDITDWDIKFLKLAQHVSDWSKDPSTKVGAVVVDKDNRIVSIGYNGFPKGVQDDERLEDRDIKYSLILHAEENALLFSKQNLKNCKIYTYPLFPCSRCCAKIIQCGITEIIALKNDNSRWKDSIDLSIKICEEVGISYKFASDL